MNGFKILSAANIMWFPTRQWNTFLTQSTTGRYVTVNGPESVCIVILCAINGNQSSCILIRGTHNCAIYGMSVMVDWKHCYQRCHGHPIMDKTSFLNDCSQTKKKTLMEPSGLHSLRLLNNLHHLPYGLSIAVNQRGYLYRCHQFTFIWYIG